MAMQTWNTTYERIGWTRQTPVHLLFVAVCGLVFLTGTVGMVRTWRRWCEGRVARAFAVFVAVANLAFLVWLGGSLRTLGENTPLPARDIALLMLGVAAAAVALMLPGFAAIAWRERWWTSRARAAFTLITVSAVAFAAWLDYWKLLGFRY